MSLLINAIYNVDSLVKITDSPKPGTANSAPLSDEGEGMKNSATDANPREKVESPEASDSPASGDPLRKRLQELQKQLQEQQQQLQVALSASYSSPDAKAASVIGLQGQIAVTLGALQQISAEIAKQAVAGSTGSMVNITA